MCKSICNILHCNKDDLVCYIVCQFIKDCIVFVYSCSQVRLSDVAFGVVHGQYIECTITLKPDVMPDVWKFFEHQSHIGFYHVEQDTIGLRLSLSKIVCDYDKTYSLSN